MSVTMQKVQLALITLITIAFLWATMPGQAHAQSREVCSLLVHPIDPRTQEQLPQNQPSGLDPRATKHIA